MKKTNGTFKCLTILAVFAVLSGCTTSTKITNQELPTNVYAASFISASPMVKTTDNNGSNYYFTHSNDMIVMKYFNGTNSVVRVNEVSIAGSNDGDTCRFVNTNSLEIDPGLEADISLVSINDVLKCVPRHNGNDIGAVFVGTSSDKVDSNGHYKTEGVLVTVNSVSNGKKSKTVGSIPLVFKH